MFHSSGWKQERRIVIIAGCVSLMIGAMTGHYLISVLCGSIAYITWSFWRLYRFEKWIENGARVKNLPDFMGAYSDIGTHLIKQKKGSLKRRKQLQKMVRVFNKSAQHASDATVVLDLNQEITWMNKAAQRDLGLQPKRDYGLRIQNVWRDLEFAEFIQAAILDSSQIFTSPINNDRYFDVRLSAHIEGGLMLIARDVSVLVQTDELRRDFVSNASHELKTPLTVMMGYLELLRDDMGIDESLKPLIGSVSLQATRMHAMLDDLLCLSRIESGDNRAHEDVDMTALLEQSIKEVRQLPEFNHKIISQCDSALMLSGACQDLQSICSNLIFNAVLHTPPHSTIKISWKKKHKTAVLIIKDNGDGIEAHHLNRLTERFYRVVSGRERSDETAAQGRGTGLGLAIVKHVVHAHYGELCIKSELGKGSEFKCIFKI